MFVRDRLKQSLTRFGAVTLGLLLFSTPVSASGKTIYNYDSNGRLLSITTWDGQTVQYTYDQNGNVIQVSKEAGGIGNIDAINYDKGKVTITGWALDKSRVSSLKVYIDDQYYGEAEYGLRRDDVYNQFPSYNNRNSGFRITIDIGFSVRPVTRTVTIIQYGNDGKFKEHTKNFLHLDRSTRPPDIEPPITRPIEM